MNNSLKVLGAAALLSASAAQVQAQYVPTHPKYITYIDGGKNFTEYFPTWEPGKQLSEDENFFISRVRIKERFINRNSQVVVPNSSTFQKYNNERKFSLCTPMGISDTYWQTLPRYVMDGDNFGLWSYVDYQDGWSQSWIRNVGAYSDVCHKNGVQNSGGVVFFDSWGGDNTGSNATVNLITQTNSDGSFKYLSKFCQFLHYYGIDGLTFNPEGFVPNASKLQDFFIQVREKMQNDYKLPFHVCWYGTNQNNGYMDLGSVLTAGKQDWFVKGGKDVCDVYFLNYDWHLSYRNSAKLAEELREGSTPNLFGGYDIQGNWLDRATWTSYKTTPMSICFWGNHTTDMIYQNSTELGSSDEAVQKNYITKQEQVFCGGNRNVANLPAITNGIGSSSTAAMMKFHGIASLMPARSSLQELPFITRFTLGNGKCFRLEGKEQFQGKWYSLSSQDYLPTWRWWITDESGKAPSQPIEAGFTFDDSWYAGSCMTMSGATTQSIVRLFKTNFNVSAGDAVNFIYKLTSGTASHARLFWSFVGSESELHYAAIPAAKQEGEWAEFKTTASAIGMTGNVAVLGIAYDNTPADYKMLVGELGIVPGKSYSPVTPKITKSELLDRTFNTVSYKLIWDCGKSAAAQKDPSTPTYNEDVDTWYYEVYSQAEGMDPVLDGMTTSWAHYIVGAFASPEIQNYRFGVRAVAPDGKTATDIVWSEWESREVTFVEGVSVDRPVIKAGEQFTASFTDPLHPAVKQWRIVDPATGKDAVTPAENATSITATINELGTYDLIINNESVDESEGTGDKKEAAPQVFSANDIVEGTVYTIRTKSRGGLTVTSTSDTRLYGTLEEGVGQKFDPTDVRQQFQFVKQDGKVYLYSVATKKYVSATKQGTLTAEPKDAIYFANASAENVRLYFTDKLNINLGGSCQISIDDWTSKDDGNSFIIQDVIAGDDTPKTSGELVYRGLIQVSTDATGAVPVITDFNAEKTSLTAEDPTTAVSIEAARLGEGTVSRGLFMEDGSQFRIPNGALPATQKTYSVGFWIKPDKFAHSKYGTNLINKRNYSKSWPHNNWGAFWVHCWPEWKDNSGNVVLDENVISYTMYNSSNAGSLAGNKNIHETPFYTCVTDRQHPCGQTYALKPGTWSHVMITYDGSSQSIFFNGKLAVRTQTSFDSSYGEAPIYIGGSNVYHAGIMGTIDDVQVWHKALTEAEVKAAMQGYEGKTVPAELKAYYTFEQKNADNTFPNLGSGAKTLTGAYVNLEGAAGENTVSTIEVILDANNNVLGNPTLPGTLEVKTTATVEVEGFGSTSTVPTSATITARPNVRAGAHDATVRLTNMWGSSELTKKSYIYFSGDAPDGINRHNTDVISSDEIFNVAGQRVVLPTKGVYLQHGKKIVK